jgi:UPF0176 protein
MKNILFYKFKKLENLETLKEDLLAKAKNLNLLGKILIAEEGVNGCVSGEDEKIEEFKTYITHNSIFGPIEFKEGDTDRHTFRKMFVRIRKEIITFKQDMNFDKKAEYIEPKELKELLDKGEEIILVDARNNYESRIGKFKDAVAPNITVFSELPEILSKMPELKNKKIVTYCTGGIRCEKSATWMVQNGFKDVKQLHGGIIRYGKECGNSYWEGKCFVFDRRGAVDIDPTKQSEHITQCEQCAIPCSDYHNCANVECDKRVILCEECYKMLEYCCNKACRGTVRLNPSLSMPDKEPKAQQVCLLN